MMYTWMVCVFTGMGYKEAEAVASKKRSLCNGKLVLPEIGQRLRACYTPIAAKTLQSELF